MGPYFVVTHAATGTDGHYIRRLFADLVDAVGLRLAARNGPVGVLSGPRRVPAEADTTITPEVFATPVLIAIYTPEFLRSPHACGEWSIFWQRQLTNEQITGNKRSALLGLRWAPIDPVPAEVEQTVVRMDLGSALGDTIRHSGGQEPYPGLVRGLVDQIVTAAAPDRLVPAMSPDSAAQFTPRWVAAASPELLPSAPKKPGRASGATRVGLVVAAGAAEEQPPQRRDRQYYGADSAGWQPFLPGVETTALALAYRSIYDLDIGDVVAFPFDEGIVEQVRAAAETNRIVLVVVDPWVSRIDVYRQLLTWLGQQDLRNSTVAACLLVVNPTDVETSRHEAELLAGITEHLSLRRRAAAGRVDRFAVPTPQQLDAGLAEAVVGAQNALLRRRRLPADVDSGPVAARERASWITTPDHPWRPRLRRPVDDDMERR
ncbi:hypothetical protein CryarDRAFT_0544 [Cryptosporangium arvum DSM 44712]|uniref:TIR domain-containing protein n=1 Tax=Cryptosporangium arvum DSM 44712 TaxID=927661 RepID=A0A010YWH7_9ACTN|nr:hypothetical protein CryarDRAFT_0544 [Cryptosporangium arvum DSM 44712]